MNQFKPEFALYRNRYFWAVITAVILIAGLTVSVADAGQPGTQIASVQADLQMIDTDGDGQTEPFSADVNIYSDGSADGTIQYHTGNLTLKRGICTCASNGQPTIVLFGTRHEYRNGQWVEIGEIEIKIQPGRENSPGDLLWSDDTSSHSFYFNGKLLVERDFRDEQ